MPADPDLVSKWWSVVVPILSFLFGAILLWQETSREGVRDGVLIASMTLMGLPATLLVDGYLRRQK